MAHAALSIALWDSMMQREGDKDTRLGPATVCPARDARVRLGAAAAITRCPCACFLPLAPSQTINTSVERGRVLAPPISLRAPLFQIFSSRSHAAREAALARAITFRFVYDAFCELGRISRGLQTSSGVKHECCFELQMHSTCTKRHRRVAGK